VRGGAEFSAGVQGFAEAVGEEAGFEAGGAEDGLLGDSDALATEEFLGVDGLVEGDQVFQFEKGCDSVSPGLIAYREAGELNRGRGRANRTSRRGSV
jgi:hypothetical protein